MKTLDRDLNVRDGQFQRVKENLARFIVYGITALSGSIMALLKRAGMSARGTESSLGLETVRAGILNYERKSEKEKKEPHQFHNLE